MSLRAFTVEDYDRVLDADVLTGLLASLSDDQREVLWLRFIEDLDTHSVGEIIGRSANAVAALTTRALRALHQRIGGHLDAFGAN